VASLWFQGEAQVTIRPTGAGACGRRRLLGAVSLGEISRPNSGGGQGWLETERLEGSTT
jgi:hypothetical protein